MESEQGLDLPEGAIPEVFVDKDGTLHFGRGAARPRRRGAATTSTAAPEPVEEEPTDPDAAVAAAAALAETAAESSRSDGPSSSRPSPSSRSSSKREPLHPARQRRHPARRHTGQGRHQLRNHFGGWVRSLPDPLRLVSDTFGIPLKTEVDPRSEMPPVFDQGKLGSCTANAAAAAFQYDAMLDGNFTGPLSRLWLYYQERKLEDALGKGDTGARGSDAFKVAQHIGIPAETDWPYDIATYQGPPPERAVRDEDFYRLTKPYAMPPLTKHSFKQVFSNQQTICFGFEVYESFESPAVAKSGIVPMPKRGEEVLGGHEVLAVGYLKSEPDYVFVRNSWGSRKTGGRGWGLNGSGYFLMPWRMILDPELCGDWTTIVRPIYRR